MQEFSHEPVDFLWSILLHPVTAVSNVPIEGRGREGEKEGERERERGGRGERERDVVLSPGYYRRKTNCNAIPNSDVVSYNVMTVSKLLVQSCIVITLYTMHSIIGKGRCITTQPQLCALSKDT